MCQHLNMCKIHKVTYWLTLSFVCLCMTLYDFVWLCMPMYDYVWLFRHGKTQRHQRHASGTIRATVRNHQDCCRAKRGTINWITKTGKVVTHLVRQPHSWWSCLTIDEVASHMMRWPQSCETALQQTSEAASLLWGCFTTGASVTVSQRITQWFWVEAASIINQWGHLKFWGSFN